jgi:hypothetical protein
MRSRRSRSRKAAYYSHGSESDDSGPFSLEEEPQSRARGGKWLVPKRWIKFLFALYFLVPIAFVWTQTFFTLFAEETFQHRFWATSEFWHFGVGIIMGLIAFFLLGKPIDCPGLRKPWLLLFYVFGHELTHAVWVWLMGGRVSEFKVGSEGGYIMTDKQNVVISLAPYFYPIYSIFVVFVYAIGSMFWDLAPYLRFFFIALGFTWTFHICFTAWMIPKGQSDLTEHGTFFSLAFIYVMNIALITGLVLLTAPKLTFHGFASLFLKNTIAFCHVAAQVFTWVMEHLPNP